MSCIHQLRLSWFGQILVGDLYNTLGLRIAMPPLMRIGGSIDSEFNFPKDWRCNIAIFAYAFLPPTDAHFEGTPVAIHQSGLVVVTTQTPNSLSTKLLQERLRFCRGNVASPRYLSLFPFSPGN